MNNHNDNGANTSNTYHFNWYVDPTTIPAETISDDGYDDERNGAGSIWSASNVNKFTDPITSWIRDNTASGLIHGDVLNIGCGSGYHDRMQAQFDTIDSIIGVDVNQSSIDAANNDHLADTDSKCSFVCDNILDYMTTMDDTCVDVVQIYNAFEHFVPSHVPRLLRQIKRILKPDGKLCIIVPFKHFHDCPEHHAHYDVGQFKCLMIYHGFDVIECYHNTEHNMIFSVVGVK